MHDYFYGSQAEQFSFYRVPKLLFTDERYKSISSEAKTLYGILLDRMNLSAKNGWLDDQGRVYIIYTTDEVMRALGCAKQKAIKLLAELEKKAKLIERRRQGLTKPNLIYVKNFISSSGSNPNSNFMRCENHTSGDVKTIPQEFPESYSNNTDSNNTEISDTDPILSGLDEDRMDNRESYEAYFRDALYIDYLIQDHPQDEETICGILDLLVDTCCSGRKSIRIAADDKPTEVVRSRLMKLTKEHIEYVLWSLSQTTTKVHNIKQYLLAGLYNAPTTMTAYYENRVNHDLAKPTYEESGYWPP